MLETRWHISRSIQWIATRCVKKGDSLAGGYHVTRTEHRPLEILLLGQVDICEIVFREDWDTGLESAKVLQESRGATYYFIS